MMAAQWDGCRIRDTNHTTLFEVHKKLQDAGANIPTHEMFISWVRVTSEILRRQYDEHYQATCVDSRSGTIYV